MLDFVLTDEQKQYQQLAHDFASNEIVPLASACDESGEFADVIYTKAFELGLTNPFLPADFDGLGLSIFESCLITEELAWSCAGINAAFDGNLWAIAPLLIAGTKEQKSEFLAPFAVAANFAGCELGQIDKCAGGNGQNLSFRAEVDANGYLITGTAKCVLNAPAAKWFYLQAVNSKNEVIHFIVPSDSKGLQVTAKKEFLGLHAADIAELKLDRVSISDAHILDYQGSGDLSKLVLSMVLPVVASGAVGIARRAMEQSIVYAKERVAFSKPISANQAIQFLVADMAKDIEAARLLSWQAARLYDQGIDNFEESLAAWIFACEAAIKVSTDAVQVYGGYGYSREYPVEKLMRDSKTLQVLYGNTSLGKSTLGEVLTGMALSQASPMVR